MAGTRPCTSSDIRSDGMGCSWNTENAGSCPVHGDFGDPRLTPRPCGPATMSLTIDQPNALFHLGHPRRDPDRMVCKVILEPRGVQPLVVRLPAAGRCAFSYLQVRLQETPGCGDRPDEATPGLEVCCASGRVRRRSADVERAVAGVTVGVSSSRGSGASDLVIAPGGRCRRNVSYRCSDRCGWVGLGWVFGRVGSTRGALREERRTEGSKAARAGALPVCPRVGLRLQNCGPRGCDPTPGGVGFRSGFQPGPAAM